MADATSSAAPTEDPASPGPRPVHVAIAFWVFLALVAVKLVLLPFTAIQQWSITDRDIANTTAKDGASVGDAVAGTLHGSNVFSDLLVFALLGLCLLAVFRIRRGAGWARIVLTVLGAVSIATAALAWSSLLALALGAAGAVGTVLLWLPRANAWFRAARAIRLAEAQRRAQSRGTVGSAPLDTSAPPAP